MLEILVFIESVGEPHVDRDGQPVHCSGLVPLDGHGVDGVAGDFTLYFVVAVLGVDDGERSLSLYAIFEGAGELVAQRGVDQCGVVAEGLDIDGFGSGIDVASGEGHREPATHEGSDSQKSQ